MELYGKFKWSQEYLDDFISQGQGDVIIASKAFSPSYIKFDSGRDVPTNLLSRIDCGIGTSEDATKALKKELGAGAVFDYPKPVEMIEYLCSFSGKSKQSVLDVFAGSGTTGVAVAKHNMETEDEWSALVESSEKNIEAIKKRIENASA